MNVALMSMAKTLDRVNPLALLYSQVLKTPTKRQPHPTCGIFISDLYGRVWANTRPERGIRPPSLRGFEHLATSYRGEIKVT